MAYFRVSVVPEHSPLAQPAGWGKGDVQLSVVVLLGIFAERPEIACINRPLPPPTPPLFSVRQFFRSSSRCLWQVEIILLFSSHLLFYVRALDEYAPHLHTIDGVSWCRLPP